jgi:hypothetical protein
MGEGHVEDARERLRQQRLAGVGRTAHGHAVQSRTKTSQDTRGSGGNGPSTSGTAKNASGGSSPEARHLRGLKLADHLE